MLRGADHEGLDGMLGEELQLQAPRARPCPPPRVGGPSVPVETRERARVARSEASPAARDPAALIEELAAEVGPRAFGVAMSMLGDRAAAEDALHDAFLLAAAGAKSFRGDSSLRTWFLTIVVNCCRRHRRLWRRWVLGVDVPEAAKADVDQGASDVHGDPGLRALLDSAVRRLPHRQRTAFVLRYQHDMTIDEVAAVMECAPGTVKATLHKAVLKLRKELEDVGGGAT